MATTYYARGQGFLRVADRDSTGRISGWSELGDADVFQLTSAQENLVFRESQTGARAKVLDTVTSTDFNVAMTLRSFDTANLKRALYGSLTSGTGASVTAEAHKAYAGTSIFVKHPGISAVTVTKLPSTNLVLNTDYTIDAVTGRIDFLPGSAVITGTGSHDVTVNYTYATYDGRVQGLGVGAPSVMLRADLTDSSGKKLIATLWNVRLSTPASIDLISTEVGALQLTGGLQAAPEITTAGLSQFFEVIRL